MKVKLHKAINFYICIKDVFRFYKQAGNKHYKLQTLPLGTSGTTLWSNLSHISKLTVTLMQYICCICEEILCLKQK